MLLPVFLYRLTAPFDWLKKAGVDYKLLIVTLFAFILEIKWSHFSGEKKTEGKRNIHFFFRIAPFPNTYVAFQTSSIKSGHKPCFEFWQATAVLCRPRTSMTRWGQDGWISAKFFLRTHYGPRRKGKINIQINYMAEWTNPSCGIHRAVRSRVHEPVIYAYEIELACGPYWRNIFAGLWTWPLPERKENVTNIFQYGPSKLV